MSVHTCPQCGAQYASAIAMMFCCDESAYGEAD